MAIHTKLELGKQSVCLTSNDSRVKVNLSSIKSRLTLYEKVQDPHTKVFHSVVKAKFFLYEDLPENKFSITVSINMLNEILIILRICNIQNTVEVVNKEYNFNKVDFKLKDTFVPREAQEMFIKALIEENDTPSYLLDLRPGYGKSLIGYHASCRLNYKFALLIKPSYVEKWIEDIKKYSDIDEDEYYVIKGRSSLVKLFDMDKSKIDRIKIYVLSMRTITNYYYLSVTEDYFKVPYNKFTEFTGICDILNDESHKEYEALYKAIMWLNPYKLLGLSATMDSDKPNMNFFYNLLYPKKDRLVSMFGEKNYLDLHMVDYVLGNGVYLQHKTHRGYNHILFEQSIMRNITILKNYTDMIIHYIDKYYIDYAIGKEKCLIFFSTIDMCTIFAKMLINKYPDKVIKRYVGEDNYYEMLTGDIIVTTNMSTGTAIDIPGLVTAIQTVCISDKQLNIQAAGRLREIPDRTVRYISIQSKSIDKQRQLKDKRIEILKKKVSNIFNEMYDTPIGSKGGVNNGNQMFANKKFYRPKLQRKSYTTFNSSKKQQNTYGKKKW